MGLEDNLRELEMLRQALAASQEQHAFGREVRHARTNRGMTLDALATATGMAKSYLSQIETSYAPPPRDDKVRKIAAALGLDEDALVAQAHLSQLPDGVKERMARLREVFDSAEEVIRALLAARGAAAADGGLAAAGTAAGAPSAAKHGESPGAGAAALDLDALHCSGLLHHLAEWGDDRVENRERLRRIPVINKVSAGYPQEFTDLGYPVGIADEYISAPPELTDPNAFAVRVVGDSMEPKYHEGDTVIFSPAASVKSGDDCFVRFAMTGRSGDGQSAFKRVFWDGPDLIRLQPINERHPPAVVKPSEIAAIFRAVARYEKL
jgi:SOS-response transcriptional repressor LexA